jgi:hypothetical protein
MAKSRKKKVDLDGPPTPESSRELGQVEGRAEMICKIEDRANELRADANALERSAHLIEEVPTGLPAIERSMAATMLQAMAGGIRFAVNRMTDSGLPF